MKVGNKDIEEQVFSIVKRLLINQGVKGWNMDDLARESGLSKRTLYKIIGRKEELLTKIVERSLSKYISIIKQYTNESSDYNVLLDKLSETIVNNFDEFVITSSDSITREYPQIKQIILKKREELRKSNIEFYRRGQKLGYIIKQFDPETIIKIIDALIDYNINETNSKKEFEIELNKALRIIIRGIKQ